VHKMVFGDPDNVKKWNKNVAHAEVGLTDVSA
jgi:hypothetical protein